MKQHLCRILVTWFSILFTIACMIFTSPLQPQQCTSPVYCTGKLLDTMQRSGLFLDSKTFVDMPTKLPESEVLSNFSKLPSNVTRVQLHEFLVKNFMAPGSDLEYPLAVDWKPKIKLLDRIKDESLRTWIYLVHKQWQVLLRKYNGDILCPGCISSHLNLPHAFVIPGGRFREFYYWDTYWILKGLYISEMHDTAKGIILNLLMIIDAFGFVPNGSRIYYMNRSQPPMMPQIIDEYLEAIGGLHTREAEEFLTLALPLLDKEYSFWMEHRSVDVGHLLTPEEGMKPKVVGQGPALLNMYNVTATSGPRPESWLEDVHLGSSFTTDAEKLKWYRQVQTTAESGWDFSSRWMRTAKKQKNVTATHTSDKDVLDWKKVSFLDDIESFPSNMTETAATAPDVIFSNQNSTDHAPVHLRPILGMPDLMEYSVHVPPSQLQNLLKLRITEILPLDLNAILLRNEKILSKLHGALHMKRNVTGDSNPPKQDKLQLFYQEAYRSRYQLMRRIFYDDRPNTNTDDEHPGYSNWGDRDLYPDLFKSKPSVSNHYDLNNENGSSSTNPMDTMSSSDRLGSASPDSGNSARNKLNDTERKKHGVYVSDYSMLWFQCGQDLLPETYSIIDRKDRNQLVKNLIDVLTTKTESNVTERSINPDKRDYHSSNPSTNDVPFIEYSEMKERSLPAQEKEPKKLLSYPGGIPISLSRSGQQWDLPNAWAPYQFYIVKALLQYQIEFDTSSSKTNPRLEGQSLPIPFKDSSSDCMDPHDTSLEGIENSNNQIHFYNHTYLGNNTPLPLTTNSLSALNFKHDTNSKIYSGDSTSSDNNASYIIEENYQNNMNDNNKKDQPDVDYNNDNHSTSSVDDFNQSNIENDEDTSADHNSTGKNIEKQQNMLNKPESSRKNSPSHDNVHRAISLKIAQNFLSSVYCGWLTTNAFYEKYNVEYPGLPGTGGEYTVQEGFGWTNAVILALVHLFPNELILPNKSVCNLTSPDIQVKPKKEPFFSPEFNLNHYNQDGLPGNPNQNNTTPENISTSNNADLHQHKDCNILEGKDSPQQQPGPLLPPLNHSDHACSKPGNGYNLNETGQFVLAHDGQRPIGQDVTSTMTQQPSSNPSLRTARIVPRIYIHPFGKILPSSHASKIWTFREALLQRSFPFHQKHHLQQPTCRESFLHHTYTLSNCNNGPESNTNSRAKFNPDLKSEVILVSNLPTSPSKAAFPIVSKLEHKNQIKLNPLPLNNLSPLIPRTLVTENGQIQTPNEANERVPVRASESTTLPNRTPKKRPLSSMVYHG